MNPAWFMLNLAGHRLTSCIVSCQLSRQRPLTIWILFVKGILGKDVRPCIKISVFSWNRLIENRILVWKLNNKRLVYKKIDRHSFMVVPFGNLFKEVVHKNWRCETQPLKTPYKCMYVTVIEERKTLVSLSFCTGNRFFITISYVSDDVNLLH